MNLSIRVNYFAEL